MFLWKKNDAGVTPRRMRSCACLGMASVIVSNCHTAEGLLITIAVSRNLLSARTQSGSRPATVAASERSPVAATIESSEFASPFDHRTRKWLAIDLSRFPNLSKYDRSKRERKEETKRSTQEEREDFFWKGSTEQACSVSFFSCACGRQGAKTCARSECSSRSQLIDTRSRKIGHTVVKLL